MAKSKSSAGLIFMLIVVLASAGGTWYYFYGRPAKEPEYSTVKVQRGSVVQTISATGNLQTTSQVTISSQVSGNVIDINADFNKEVKAGQWLLKIDPSTYEQKAKQAKADLVAQTASTVKVREDTKRTKDLYDRNLESKANFDAAVAQLAQSESSLISREAAAANAQTDLERCVIYSPIDGIVLNRTIDKGATVNVNQSAVGLFTIINDLSKLQISADVSEADIGNVLEGQLVSFAVDAYLGRNFSGNVSQVRNFAKNTSGVVTFSVIIDVDNSNRLLKPGMTATANIIITERPDVLTVANNALRVRIPAELAEKMKKAAPATEGGAPAAPVAAAPVPAAPEMGAPGGEQGGTQGGARRGNRGGGGGRGRGGMGSGVATGTGMNVSNRPLTVYKLVTDAAGKKMPEAVTVHLGISNGTITQVIDGVAEGDTLITYVTMPGAAVSATAGAPGGQTGNPFQQGGGRGGGGRGGF